MAMAGTAAERRRQRRIRRWAKRLAVSGLLAGLAAGVWAFEGAAEGIGLKGIFPADPPAALSAEAFEPLGESWAEWNASAVAAIDDFYKLEGDVAAQRAALAKLKSKLGVINKALADNQYASIHKPLMSLHGPLARRIAVAEAVLATLETDPQAARGSLLKSRSAAVTAALAALKADLQPIEGGSAWLPYVKAEALETALAASPEGDATVAALQATQAQIAKRDNLSDASQKAFLSRDSFSRLHAAVGELLTVASKPATPADPAALRAELAKLVAALEDYEATSSSVAAAQVRASLAAVNGQLGGSSPLQDVLTEQYSNYNVRIMASESFLSRLLSDARVEQGQVRDFILGANVGGWQTTSSNVGVDIKPASDRVRFDLVLTGTVQSNTAGATTDATVYTYGYHTFRSTKEISFDGQRFTSAPALTYVNASNTTTGASTRLSGTLFAGIGQRIAMREAAARRPQSEAIARSRVADRVTPRFNEEADKAFNKATEDIQKEFNAGLKAAGIYPDEQQYLSTDSAVFISTRLMPGGKLGGSAPERRLLASTGASLALHESVVNNTIDEIGFAGKTMSEEELRHHLEGFLSKALSRDFKFRAPAEAAAAEATPAPADAEAEEAAKGMAKLAFANEDPVRVQFGDGVLLLVIRAGLEREGQDPIPLHEISVPLRLSVSGESIVVSRDALKIVPVEGRFSPVQQKVMNTRISNALPERTVSGKFKLKGPSREVEARVTDITLVDGWISVSAE